MQSEVARVPQALEPFGRQASQAQAGHGLSKLNYLNLFFFSLQPSCSGGCRSHSTRYLTLHQWSEGQENKKKRKKKCSTEFAGIEQDTGFDQQREVAPRKSRLFLCLQSPSHPDSKLPGGVDQD